MQLRQYYPSFYENVDEDGYPNTELDKGYCEVCGDKLPLEQNVDVECEGVCGACKNSLLEDEKPEEVRCGICCTLLTEDETPTGICWECLPILSL